jgi:hypothetical protein
MSRSYRAGLVLLGIVSAADLALPLLTDGETPPMSVALVGSALGLASLVLVWYAWRGARRAVVPLVVLRLLSALTAVPAFLAGGVPAPALFSAAVLVVLTLVGVSLVVGAARREALAGAR